MSDLLSIDLPEMIAELAREVEMRRNYYGRMVREGRMNRITADRRISVMVAAREQLVQLQEQRKAQHGNRAV